jgi:putative alpha-1,2-mannosidase
MRMRFIQRKTDAALYSAQSESCAEFSATVNLRQIPRKAQAAWNDAQNQNRVESHANAPMIRIFFACMCGPALR